MSKSSQAGIPANLSAPQAKGKAKKTRATSGRTSSTPFAQYDPDTRSWRTCEDTLVSDSEPFSETWPPSGSMQSGKCYPRPRLVRHTVATASLSLHTPTAKMNQMSPSMRNQSRWWPTPISSPGMAEDIENVRKRLENGTPYKSRLIEAVALWPTPKAGGMLGGSGAAAMIEKKYSSNEITSEERRAMRSGNGGKLNPMWVEWLMGFPLGWTDLEDSETQ